MTDCVGRPRRGRTGIATGAARGKGNKTKIKSLLTIPSPWVSPTAIEIVPLRGRTQGAATAPKAIQDSKLQNSRPAVRTPPLQRRRRFKIQNGKIQDRRQDAAATAPKAIQDSKLQNSRPAARRRRYSAEGDTKFKMARFKIGGETSPLQQAGSADSMPRAASTRWGERCRPGV